MSKLKSSLFYDLKHHLQQLGRGSAVRIFSKTISQVISDKDICRTALATLGLLKTSIEGTFLPFLSDVVRLQIDQT